MQDMKIVNGILMVEVDSEFVFMLLVEYFFNDNIFVELLLVMLISYDIFINGVEVVKIKYLLLILIVKYNFKNLIGFMFYIGVGVIVFIVWDEEILGVFLGIKVKVKDDYGYVV